MVPLRCRGKRGESLLRKCLHLCGGNLDWDGDTHAIMRPLLASLALLAGSLAFSGDWNFKIKTAESDEVEVKEVRGKDVLFVESSGAALTKDEARKIGWALITAACPTGVCTSYESTPLRLDHGIAEPDTRRLAK